MNQKIIIETSNNQIRAKGYFSSTEQFTAPEYVVIDCPEEFNNDLPDLLKYINNEIVHKTEQEISSEESARILGIQKLELGTLIQKKNALLEVQALGVNVDTELLPITERIDELKIILGIV